MDYITGNGGFPRSKVSEIFGVPSSGKSTLAAMACAKAQKMGLYPVYVDVERGLDGAWASKLGFDVPAAKRGERGLYVTPETFEDTLVVIETMATEGLADLIVVDSVAALVPKDTFEKSIVDIGQLGLSARLFAASLPKLTKIIDRPGHKTALVFVNQMRANIQTGYNAGPRPETKPGGGWALAHYSSLRVELKQINKSAKTVEVPSIVDPTKKDKVPVASLHTAMTYKNKVSLPYRRIEFYIRYDEHQQVWGIDNLQTILDIATAKGLIEHKGGGNYLYNGSTEVVQTRGEPALYDWFKTHPDEVGLLRTKLGL